MEWVVVVLAAASLGFALGALGLGRLRRRRANTQWADIARKLELVRGPRGAALRGRSRGIEVEMLPRPGYAELRGWVKGPLPDGLNLFAEARRGIRLSALADVKLRDPELDAAVVVQGENPAEVIRLLRDEAVRPAVLGFFGRHPNGRITGGEVVLQRVALADLEPSLKDLVTTTLALGEAGARRLEAISLLKARAALEPVPVGAAKGAGFVPGHAKISPSHEAWIIGEFARRSRRSSRFLLLSPVAFGLMWLGAWFAGWSWLAGVGIGLQLVAVLGWLGSGTCPACGKVVTLTQQERFPAGFPESCPKCGVRLSK